MNYMEKRTHLRVSGDKNLFVRNSMAVMEL